MRRCRVTRALLRPAARRPPTRRPSCARASLRRWPRSRPSSSTTPSVRGSSRRSANCPSTRCRAMSGRSSTRHAGEFASADRRGLHADRPRCRQLRQGRTPVRSAAAGAVRRGRHRRRLPANSARVDCAQRIPGSTSSASPPTSRAGSCCRPRCSDAAAGRLLSWFFDRQFLAGGSAGVSDGHSCAVRGRTPAAGRGSREGRGANWSPPTTMHSG